MIPTRPWRFAAVVALAFAASAARGGDPPLNPPEPVVPEVPRTAGPVLTTPAGEEVTPRPRVAPPGQWAPRARTVQLRPATTYRWVAPEEPAVRLEAPRPMFGNAAETAAPPDAARQIEA